MKKFIKILVLVLAVSQILCCFNSCKKEKEAEEPIFELTLEDLSKYEIVIPKADASMNSAATVLQGMVESATGVKLNIKTDEVIEGSVTIMRPCAPPL